MKILILSRYGRLGASSRIRTYQYLQYLKAQGIHVTVAPLLTDDYLKNLYAGRTKFWGDIFISYLRRLTHLFKSHRFNLLWIEKELFPWLPAWGENLLSFMGIRYVVDYDDAIFHNYDLRAKGMIRTLLSDKIDVVMRRAAAVIVGNDYLAERAREAGAQRVEYLPTVIDLDRYSVKPLTENPVFTIGWIGSPATTKYLHIIAPALAEVCRSGNAQLVLLGAGQFKLNDIPVKIRAWSEETEVEDIQDFDVGIMPLPDEPWERGKCGYKLIQYMACGRPVIASPVGVNQKIVEDGVNGFLATTEAEWLRALNRLRDDRGLRERMGREGRSKVETQYCIQVTAPHLVSMLSEAVNGSY